MNTQTSTTGSSPLSPTEGARILAVVWRFLLVVSGSYFAAVLMYGAVKTGGNTMINVATSGVAASVLVAFFSDILALFSGCRAYIKGKQESLNGLTNSFWKAW